MHITVSVHVVISGSPLVLQLISFHNSIKGKLYKDNLMSHPWLWYTDACELGKYENCQICVAIFLIHKITMYSQHSNKQYAQTAQPVNPPGFSQQQFYQGYPQNSHQPVRLNTCRMSICINNISCSMQQGQDNLEVWGLQSILCSHLP